MKEKNKEEEKVEKPIEKVVEKERPYLGYKKEKLVDLLEKWREIYSDSTSKTDKEFAKSKVSEIEQELKNRF